VTELRASGQPVAGSRPSFTGDRQADAEAFRAASSALAAGAGADVNNTALAYAAISAVVVDIDECHTYFLDPERFAQFNARSEGSQSYAGIGATIRGTSQPAIMGEVYPGTPAERAGLRSGDAILAVDGQDVTTSPVDLIASLVRGPEGTQVTLTIQRPGEPASRNLTITRAMITVPVFTARVIDGADGRKVGYMKLYSFSQGVEEQLDQALRDFKRQGVGGWVLDLRDDPGGLVTVFSAIASRFVNQAPAGIRVGKGGREQAVPIDTRRYFGTQLPFAVLVNEGSASGSEAFAAAAQDYGRARIFGEKTAGCLAVGQPQELADGSGMSITTEKYLSPKKREINQVGVQPDELVAADPTLATDPVLPAALAWLATQR
jgi:carboxyl-terminal processing protease